MRDEPVVYRQQRYGSVDQLAVALAVVGLAPVIMIGFYVHHFEVLSRPPESLLFLLATLIVPVVAVFGFVLQRRFVREARLVVDERGIRMTSGNAGVRTEAFGLPREIAWDDIAHVAVLERFGVVQLRRKGLFATPVRIEVTRWVPESEWREHPRRGARPALRASPLWKVLEARGLFAEDRLDRRLEAFDFDLMKHPATRRWLLAAAALAVYWGLDATLSPEAWAEWNRRYIIPHGVVGALGALAAFLLLRAARDPHPVPPAVTRMMAMVFGVALALASWTGLIRVNQALGGPLVEEPYRRDADCTTLVPVRAGLPRIEYTSQAKDYWCSLPADRDILVPVREGLGGLYQVDLRRHTEAIKRRREATR